MKSVIDVSGAKDKSIMVIASIGQVGPCYCESSWLRTLGCESTLMTLFAGLVEDVMIDGEKLCKMISITLMYQQIKRILKRMKSLW
jgi:hypothetical protein